MRVTINPSKPKEVFFPEESLDNYKVNLNASQNQMKKVTNFIRSHCGKNSIPAHLKL